MFDNQNDIERIEFLQGRDTPEEVLFFANQCIHQYRGAVLAAKRKFGRRNAYREAYIRSYLFHKQYVLENTNKELNSFDAIKAFDLAIKTSDAYSYDRYGNDEWVKCIVFLMQEGYSEEEIDWVLRHKHMRWAGDGYDPTCAGFQSYYEGIKKSLRQALTDIFPENKDAL